MAKKKKRRRTPIDPIHIFVNARGFTVAAVAIDREGEFPATLWPMTICAVFALELYIKCLHRIRRRNVEGHNVQILFGDLSKADKKRITTIYDDVIKLHPNYEQYIAAGILFDIDSVLTRASNLFVKGRYWHELEPPNRDANGLLSNVGIDRLSDSIRFFIFELRPDYRERASTTNFVFASVMPVPPKGTTTKE